MWWESTIDIRPGLPMKAKHLTGSDKKIACPAPREREHSPLPTGGPGRHSESPVPVKRRPASQVPRNVRFDGKHHYLWT